MQGRRALGPAVAVAVAVALALGGCAATDGAGTAGAGTAGVGPGGAGSTPAAGSPGAGAAARALLANDVATLDGPAFDAEAVADRPLALWFWAPWCTICRGEAPEVVEVAADLERSGSPVLLLGVPGRGEVPAMRDFVADTGTGGIVHLVDDDGGLWRHFGVLTQPAFAFVGTDGRVEVVNGALGGPGLRAAVARLSASAEEAG